MRARSLTMLMATLVLSFASVHAYGWNCINVLGNTHGWNIKETTGMAFPCNDCTSEYHWYVRYSNQGTCSGSVWVNGWLCGGGWWPDGYTYSLKKFIGYFGNQCLAGVYCPRCQDSTSSCSAQAFQANCCY